MLGASCSHSRCGNCSSSSRVRVRADIATSLYFNYPLAKKVVLARANQISRTAPARLVPEPAHNASRPAIKLAADEACGASQFVGDRLGPGTQDVAAGVARSPQIEHRLHSSNPDRH